MLLLFLLDVYLVCLCSTFYIINIYLPLTPTSNRFHNQLHHSATRAHQKFVSFGIFVLFHALFSVLFLCVKISRNGDRNRYREHVATMESRAENTVRYEKVFAKDFIAKNRNLNCLNQQNFVKNICNFFLLVSSLKFETIKPHQIFYIQNIETKNQLDWNAFHMRERNTITKQRFARKTKSVTSVTVVWNLIQILKIKDEIKKLCKKIPNYIDLHFI